MGFLPREVQFFDLLEAQAANVVRGAGMLLRLLESRPPLTELRAQSEAIHDVENKGDDLAHQLMARLNKTFLTPLDREDLYALCVRLDDVIDYIDAVAKRLVTFRIEEPTSYAVEFGRIIECAAIEVEGGVRLLRDLRRHEAILRQCVRINQLENEADQVMRDALDTLFNGGAYSTMDVIKWKDLYEHLEIATDKCEDVANVIESVLVKYS